jgi:BMFP domain-containing protein YqiC
MNSAKHDIQQEIATLRQRRDELRERIAQIEKDYRRGLSADSDEQAIELENAEVLNGIATATAEELASVEARLAELE